jgi:hypothetical protein
MSLTRHQQAAVQLATRAPAPDTASAVAHTDTAATEPSTAKPAANLPSVSALGKTKLTPVLRLLSPSLSLLLRLSSRRLQPRRKRSL